MSELLSSGWVIRELEPQRSQKGNLYVRFTLAEPIGRGELARRQYFEVWAWDTVAQALLDRNIGKGSRLWVRGYLELVDYVRNNGAIRDKKMKLRLLEWKELVRHGTPASPEGLQKTRGDHESGNTPVVDGEREELPE